MNLLNTLKFQIAAALTLLALLFGAVFSVSIMALEEQRRYNILLNLTSRLEHSARNLVSLGVSYAMHAPQDNQAYQRDIKLYYQSIREQTNLITDITNGFMHEKFSPKLTNMEEIFQPDLDPAVYPAVMAIEDAWAEFLAELEDSLGTDPTMPQLNQAAIHISSNHQPLTESIDALRSQLIRLGDSRLEQVNHLYWTLLITALLITSGILGWFFLTVLKPLKSAVIGFNKVSKGDFGHQVPVAGNNEISWLTGSFNQLSIRLHTIFLLIERIQQGSDVEDTLSFVAEQLPGLLPLDWIGALFVSADHGAINLEHSFFDGKHETGYNRYFKLNGTILQQALESGEPIHISDMLHTAKQNPQYQFLNYLVEKGLRDAIFLPITEQSPVPGVLAFATRNPQSYTPEHLELLTNIANLVTHSFGRTVKLVEHGRLAAIGEFASGITHEIRNPLSTITMALDYFRNAGMEGSAAKRANLAHQEALRMERLLEEILLYAKPMKLELQQLDLQALLAESLQLSREIAEQDNQGMVLLSDGAHLPIQADEDRMKQVLLNLSRNACEAAPEDSEITWRLNSDPETRIAHIEITNGGAAIPKDQLERIFEPFFTTKSHGTGLGLAIVRRIVEAHGGEIRIESGASEGTTVKMQIPLA
ncbi:MAG: ATP-binding protein [Sedimenticola sp.]